MERERIWNVFAAVVVIALAGVLVVEGGVVDVPWDGDREHARVTLVDENGTVLARVDAEVADTSGERYTGLSDHESLANGSGMLFVHQREAERTYVMRKMDFPIDIVFVDANGTVTAIHHAREPRPGEDGNTLRYSGYGKYVLEVPRGYTNATGLDVGDRIHIEYGTTTTTDEPIGG